MTVLKRVLSNPRDELGLQFDLRLDEASLLLLFHFEQGRASHKNVTRFHKFSHLAEKEGQQQRSNMLSVDIGVRQNNNLTITQFRNVIWVADVGTHRGDDAADFLVIEQMLKASFLHVQRLASKRQDRLIHPIATAFGRATGRVPFHEE